MKTWVKNHALISYFVLAYLIMFGSYFSFIILRPGEPNKAWSLVWFLGAFSPTISAIFVSWVIGGVNQVKQLLSGFKRWKVNFFWYFAASFLFLGPLLIAVIYGLLGNPVTGLRLGITIPMLLGQIFFQMFSGPISEEAGWRGFALPHLQKKFSALVSSLILGVIWTCWHIPLFFLTGATQMTIPFPIYMVLVVTQTIYATWLYNNTKGSLIITTLAHFSFNLTGTLITGLVSLMPPMLFYMTAGPSLFVIVIVVIFVYGAKYLSRKPDKELFFQK